MPIARRLLPALLLVALASTPALAQIVCLINCPPDPSNASIPPLILLVGHDGNGVADPVGHFDVVLRDLANNPIPNAVIRVDLSNAPEMHFCVSQAPGLVVNAVPGNMYVEGVTDPAGRFSASLVGGSNGAGGAVTLLGGARIFGNGVLLGSPTVAALDLDGSGGVGINDLSAWLGDFGTGQNYGRSEYDANGSVGINDLSIWLTRYGAGLSAASCSP